jgi:hypothetical protein
MKMKTLLTQTLWDTAKTVLREIIKIREEISEIETKKPYKKINEKKASTLKK